MDFNKAKQAFEKYLDDYDRNDKNISLKYRHTYKVVELMAELAFRLNLEKEEIELAKIIGLLHDIGRFEQIKKFDQKDDVNTNMDHADFGCHYLFSDYHIRDFGINEESEEAKIIEKAIKNHNKLTIENMDEKSLLFAKMIRDMDKVDIFRVLSVDFEMKFNADEISQEVLKQFSSSELVDRKIVKSTSEETLMYLSYIYDINFEESFDILVSTDNFDLFLGMIEVSENSEKLWKKVRELCFDKINRGASNE